MLIDPHNMTISLVDCDVKPQIKQEKKNLLLSNTHSIQRVNISVLTQVCLKITIYY